MSIVAHKVYGSNFKPTIYYITGYKGRIEKVKPHIYALTLGGFRIFAFEYDTAVLDSGDPAKLIQAVKEIESLVQKDQQGREVAGIYGMSLGSWLGLNVMAACDIKKGMFNTAGTSVARGIWELTRLAKEKAAFEEHGYDRQDLERIWHHYDKIETFGKHLYGRKVVILNSITDEIIRIDEAKTNITAWQDDNVDVELVTSRGLNHRRAIARHMLRVRRTISFFRA